MYISYTMAWFQKVLFTGSCGDFEIIHLTVPIRSTSTRLKPIQFFSVLRTIKSPKAGFYYNFLKFACPIYSTYVCVCVSECLQCLWPLCANTFCLSVILISSMLKDPASLRSLRTWLLPHRSCFLDKLLFLNTHTPTLSTSYIYMTIFMAPGWRWPLHRLSICHGTEKEKSPK